MFAAQIPFANSSGGKTAKANKVVERSQCRHGLQAENEHPHRELRGGDVSVCRMPLTGLFHIKTHTSPCRTHHARAVLRSLNVVVEAEGQVVALDVKAEASLPSEIIHHLRFHFSRGTYAGDASLALGFHIASSRYDRQVYLGLERPAIAHFHILGEGHTHRESPEALVGLIHTEHGAVFRRLELHMVLFYT